MKYYWDSDWGKKVRALLEKRTSINTETGCWEFSGTNADGYGQIMIDHEFFYIHRLSAMMFLSYTPGLPYLHVLHKCKSKNCWNPEHLYLGDNSQNIRDKVEAGNARGKYSDVTHCINGHEFTPENTYITIRKETGKERRQCRECRKVKNMEAKAKIKLIRKVG